MDEYIDLINSLGIADDRNVSDKRKRTLRTIWYRIGGHREKVGDLEKQLRLIESLFEFCSGAKKRIDAVLFKLEEMDTGLQGLRTSLEGMKLANPDLIDLKIHLEQIQATVNILERELDHRGTLAAGEYDKLIGKRQY